MTPDTLTPTTDRLRGRDYLLLAACCLAIFLPGVVPSRTLSGHSAVVPQTSREMLARHDWLVPTAGGEAWLERPPLSAWIISATYAAFGTSSDDRVARFAAVLVAVPTVLLAAWIASVFFRRPVALLSGLILATCWEYYNYATNPEADIFLCLVVTAAIALFVRLEFVSKATCGYATPAGMAANGTSFLGKRPWDVLAFFVVLGLTNLAKGLIFGTMMVVIPVGGYLLWNRDLRAIRRYVWLWGWLAFAAVSLAWPTFVVSRYPEMLQFWDDHYLGRTYRGYLREPVWYYAMALGRNLAPWTPVAVYGLWLTARTAFSSQFAVRSSQGTNSETADSELRTPAARFLWAWAILPPLVFTIPQAKHHHYMLYSMAPLAMLAAVASVRVWQNVLTGPRWLRQPVWSLLTLGMPLVAIILGVGSRFRGPTWVAPVLAATTAGVIFLMALFVSRRDGRVAMGGFVGVLGISLGLATLYQATYIVDYEDDEAFLRQAHAVAPPDRPLVTLFDLKAELETFWVMFYSEPRLQVVKVEGDLPAKLAGQTEAYVLARRQDAPRLSTVGRLEEVLASRHTRSERSPGDRRVLYRLTLPGHDHAAAGQGPAAAGH